MLAGVLSCALKKASRSPSNNAHNASAVLLLPFHLMITYTGLAVLPKISVPAAMDALFDGDREAFFKAQDKTPASIAVQRPTTAEPINDA